MEPVKQCGIYCYQNLINNKKYIGQSVDLENRRKNFKPNRLYSNKYLKNDVDKYGIENFRYTILTHCKEEELNYFERFYISRLRTTDRTYGYNIQNGGNSQRNRKAKRNHKPENKIKEINVIHLEIEGEHYYFGSLKKLTDTFGKDVLGIGYNSLRNVHLSPDNPYSNGRCIIRKGKLVQGKKSIVSI